jgi:Trk K+ transport system NAD-binding subunit
MRNKMKKDKPPLQMVEGQFAQAKIRLASHPDTSPEVLNQLAEKDQPELSERVAENAQTTPDTLKKLSGSHSADVRVAVTENKNTPSEILQLLAADENPDVRYRIAENPETPPPILESLAADDNPYVVARAQETLSLMRSLTQQADELLVEECFLEAEEVYTKLVEGLQQMLGVQHPEVGHALHKLAAAQAAQGKNEKALVNETLANMIQDARKSQ